MKPSRPTTKPSGFDPNLALAWTKKGLAIIALGRNTKADAAFAKAKELRNGG
jgi:hypothetical protein